MAVSDTDLEMLETWLDGELSQDQANALRSRLSIEPALAGAVEQLRADRQLRAVAWQGLDGNAAEVESLVRSVRAGIRDAVWASRFRTVRQLTSVAAAIVLMFGAGWISRSRIQVGDAPASVAVVTDPTPVVSNNTNTTLASASTADRDFRLNRSMSPSAEFGSQQTQTNPLLEPFNTRSLSVTRPMFKVQVLDAFGNVKYVKPVDSFSEAMQFADYIGKFQSGGVPSMQPNPERNIVPVNNSQQP